MWAIHGDFFHRVQYGKEWGGRSDLTVEKPNKYSLRQVIWINFLNDKSC